MRAGDGSRATAACRQAGAGGSDELDNLAALCRACHHQTDAPFSKGRLVVRALGGGIFTFDLVHAVSKWDARRAIAGTEDEPKSTDFTAASAERSGDASAITQKRAGHIAAEPGVNRADDRAMANLRAAARRRPPPFPGSTPGRPLSLDAQARERPCHCHAEGARHPRPPAHR